MRDKDCIKKSLLRFRFNKSSRGSARPHPPEKTSSLVLTRQSLTSFHSGPTDSQIQLGSSGDRTMDLWKCIQELGPRRRYNYMLGYLVLTPEGTVFVCRQDAGVAEEAGASDWSHRPGHGDCSLCGEWGERGELIYQGTEIARFVVSGGSMVFAAQSVKEVASHSLKITLRCPREGWVEQDPMELIGAVRECIGKTVQTLQRLAVDPANMVAIGLTNQRETTVVWDRTTGEPLYNAIGTMSVLLLPRQSQ
uniref:Carbohydrate kinase FGGY N-terminal domain-containing protein n=1 Tax=Timema shepardi TaxID=629360 RepID=A0A7R9BAV9_TIMSH|nr:unnamed protein product [Timema shepardi]